MLLEVLDVQRLTLATPVTIPHERLLPRATNVLLLSRMQWWCRPRHLKGRLVRIQMMEHEAHKIVGCLRWLIPVLCLLELPLLELPHHNLHLCSSCVVGGVYICSKCSRYGA